MKIKKVCETCGSEEVRVDAYAEWDVDAQAWDLHSVYDHGWCYDCDCDTHIIDQDLQDA